MKLSNAIGPLEGLWFGITIAFLPTLKAIWSNPSLLFSPSKISRVYMANLWPAYADGIDGNGKSAKEQIITPHAHGKVLDLGAGHGHTVRYLDRSRVSQYIAVEPNTLMHPLIRAQATEYGFNEADGSLVILSCGAEQTQTILSKLRAETTSSKPFSESENMPPIDTIVSVLALCTVPNPTKCVTELVRDLLKPGGYFLMYEHVLSKRADLAWWQRFWAPFWSIGFDGCRMDRPTDVLVSELKLTSTQGQEESAWKESRTWAEGGPGEENQELLFLHSFGVFVKR